jgi:hypothetical protein
MFNRSNGIFMDSRKIESLLENIAKLKTDILRFMQLSDERKSHLTLRAKFSKRQITEIEQRLQEQLPEANVESIVGEVRKLVNQFSDEVERLSKLKAEMERRDQAKRAYDHFITEYPYYLKRLDQVIKTLSENKEENDAVIDVFNQLNQIKAVVDQLISYKDTLIILGLNTTDIDLLNKRALEMESQIRQKFPKLYLPIHERIALLLESKKIENLNVTYGPLNKSEVTKKFESLVKCILDGEFTLHHDENAVFKNAYYFKFKGSVTNNQYFTFRLEDIKDVNFDHLNFTQDDLNLYVNYVKDPQYGFRYHPDFSYSHSQSLPGLHEGENIAINIYSHIAYSTMNTLMRGLLDFKGKSDKEIGEMILHIAVMSHALAHHNLQMPQPTPKFIVRKTSTTQIEDLLLRQQKDLVRDMAFLSAYNNENEADKKHDGKDVVSLIIANPDGLDVSPISQHDEQEWIVPPAQLLFLGAIRGKEEVAYIFRFLRTPGILDTLTIPAQPQQVISQSHANLSMASFENVGGEKGTMPGGTYRHKTDGDLYYIKFYPDEEQARVEVLAAKLYQLARIQVPDTSFVTDDKGNLGVASKMISGIVSAENVNESQFSCLKGGLEGFAIDAWLCNWDVAGLHKDNFFASSNLTAYRLDFGGALHFRATGGIKDSFFQNQEVVEINTLRDRAKNPAAAEIFRDVTDDHLREGASRLKSITDDMLRNTIAECFPEKKYESVRDKLFKTLCERRDKIIRDYPPLGAESDGSLDQSTSYKK